MESYIIRRAENSDMEAVNALLYQVHALHSEGRPDIFKHGVKKYTDEELAVIFSDDNTPVYVFDCGGKVLGYVFCIYKITEDGSSLCRRKTLYIDDLCVDADARGKNVGRTLYEYAAETARKNGCDSVTLNVWDFNSGAKAFYEKMGMKPLKTIMEQIL